MKLMYPHNYATAITASTENANFPVENLEDDYVGNLWKATGTVATLIIECAAGTNCLAIFNTNAESITIRLSGWESIDWETDDTEPSLGDTIVTNGSFATATTGWTSALTGVLSSVAGGHDGNCLKIENGAAAYGYAYQTMTTVIGTWYRISIYGKNGTATAKLRIGTTAGGNEILSKDIGGADWTNYIFYFRATTTTTYIRLSLSNVITETAYFDEVVIQSWVSERTINWEIDSSRDIEWISFGQCVSETLYDISASAVGNLWVEYTILDDLAHTLTITFTGTSVIQAGVLRSGIARSFRDPAYGIREGLRDYSIRKELNSGGFYYRKRGSSRTFSFELLEDRDTDFYRFLYDYAQVIGPAPAPWRIVHSGSTDWEWVVYASFPPDEMPDGSHGYKDFSTLEISLIESI